MKKLLFTLVVSSFALLGSGTAFAAEATNSDTGAESENSSHLFSQTVTEVVNKNVLTVHNDVNFDAVTGDNEASFNTGGEEENITQAVEGGGGGSVETGDAVVNVTIENDVNRNETDVDVCCEDRDGQGGGEEPEPEEPEGQNPTGEPLPFGGGELIENVETLPAAGMETLDSLAILLGLPLLLAMLITAIEQRRKISSTG